MDRARAVKPDILNRYERDEAGNRIIDIAADRVEDLYDDFDRCSPYARRDLDEGLVDYLIASARELAGVPIAIRFTWAAPAEEAKLTRIRHSLDAYFRYLAEKERLQIAVMLRRSAIFFATGLAILFASVWVNRALGPEPSIVGNVLGEGLTLVAWISLWEALATCLVEWPPYRRNVHLYRRLAGVPLIFRSEPAQA